MLSFGLPTNNQYRVRVICSSGPLDLGTFVSGAGVSGCWLASADLNGTSVLRIEIVDQNGDVVMKSNLL